MILDARDGRKGNAAFAFGAVTRAFFGLEGPDTASTVCVRACVRSALGGELERVKTRLERVETRRVQAGWADPRC